MTEWPKDMNDLVVRLKGWWSLNQWLLDDTAVKLANGQAVNRTPEQIVEYLRERAEGYKRGEAAWRERAIQAEADLARLRHLAHQLDVKIAQVKETVSMEPQYWPRDFCSKQRAVLNALVELKAALTEPQP